MTNPTVTGLDISTALWLIGLLVTVPGVLALVVGWLKYRGMQRGGRW
jgi:hypothetical protein